MSTSSPGSSEPEYLGSGDPAAEPSPRAGGARRTGLVAAVALAVVAALGAGAYGVVQLMAGGSSPATAVPGDALGYVSLDLDPSASQKIEAFTMLRKFPALAKDLGGRDDIRKAVVEGLVKDKGCSDLDYGTDVEPWIGDRVAVAAMPDPAEGAVPLLVLQVGDQAKAKAGVRALEACGAGEGSTHQPVGISFVGDYVLVAQTQERADSMAVDAERSPLSDDEDFVTALDRVGDPGIVTLYASKDAPQALAAQSRDGSPAGDDDLRATFKDFRGAAGVIRFDSGAVEAEFAAQGLPSGVGGVGEGGGPDVATLPATTAAVFAVALHGDWFDEVTKGVGGAAGDDRLTSGLLAEVERDTGLQLPEDAQTLLGSGFSLSVGAGADLDALTTSPDPTKVPAGVRITGDPSKIVPIIEKLKKAAGPGADAVEVVSGDGHVSVGFDRSYVESLLEDGDLGGTTTFQDVVPDADRAAGIFYLSFDAGDGWAERLGDLVSDGDAEVRANLAPLDAFGASTWLDEDRVQHALLRLTTD